MDNDEVKKEMAANANYVWKIRRKDELKCSYCKPHRMENESRRPRDDKYKSHRRGPAIGN